MNKKLLFKAVGIASVCVCGFTMNVNAESIPTRQLMGNVQNEPSAVMPSKTIDVKIGNQPQINQIGDKQIKKECNRLSEASSSKPYYHRRYHKK